MDIKNTQLLQNIGFTQGEIKVYLALLSLGETTVGPISKEAEVTHAKIYPILYKLIKKGLVSQISKKGRKYFSPSPPNSLLEFVNKKQRELQEEKEQIKELIPKLTAKQKTKKEPQQARVFEGFHGLRNLFQELFEQEGGEIQVLGLDEIIDNDSFVSFFTFYHDLRQKKNIHLKLILKKSMKKIIENKYTKKNFKKGEVKYIDYPFPTGIFLYNDHVISVIYQDNKLTAFDIKSKQNSERYKEFFKEAWNKK